MIKILSPRGRSKVIKGHSNPPGARREEREGTVLFFWWFWFRAKQSRTLNHSLGLGYCVLSDIKVTFMLIFILAGVWVHSGSEGLGWARTKCSEYDLKGAHANTPWLLL